MLTCLGHEYGITDTCNVDSGLFVLYFLFQTDSIMHELIDKMSTEPYTSLRATFELVDSEGWDSARLYWLLVHKRLDPFSNSLQSMFGSMDQNVYQFIKGLQRYSVSSLCSRLECPERKKRGFCTELSTL